MSFEHLALAGLFCWSNLRYLLVVMQLSAAKTLTAVFLHAWLSTLTISRTFIKLSFSHFPACDMVPHFSLEPETIAKLYRTFLCRIFIRFFLFNETPDGQNFRWSFFSHTFSKRPEIIVGLLIFPTVWKSRSSHLWWQAACSLSAAIEWLPGQLRVARRLTLEAVRQSQEYSVGPRVYSTIDYWRSSLTASLRSRASFSVIVTDIGLVFLSARAG